MAAKRPWTQRQASDTPPAVVHLLTWGDWSAAKALMRPCDNQFVLFPNGAGSKYSHKLIWRGIEDAAVDEWVEKYPGTRPMSWWLWSAPELRQVVGAFTVLKGVDRCHPTGIPFGTADDRNNLPMVESVAGYLERLQLWRDGERERVSPEALAPVRFSVALHTSPNEKDYNS